MDSKSATGPDKIPTIFMKNCSTTISQSLAHIFHLSLRASDLPIDFKSAAVTPIPKDGDRTKFMNWRPIFVTSLVGKVLEKHVRNKSCTTMLVRTLDDWSAALDNQSGAHVIVVFLDWVKALDKVPHQRLLTKLQHYGVDGAALKWLKSFLVSRSQFVRFNGACSESYEVPSGVIQGSVLGPLLFNVFVADMPSVVQTNLVHLRPRAEGKNLSTTLRSPHVAWQQSDRASGAISKRARSKDLTRIDVWCTNNGMKLNAKKCVVMDVTCARRPYTPHYTVGGAALEYVASQRLLGVHISRNLRWNHHVDVQRKSAARNLHSCSNRVKRIAYLSLVKPKLFYGNPAWHPSTKTNIEKMCRVQNRVLHFIYGRHVPPPAQQKLL
ncbi:Hypothetical predicted protein [Cloeon dipterum]|uniref:Reverse transcriptase domain-containing protein n=1 Tax=Cloeon dipterum TaxID=197152 RepID=A0A8S1DWN2_9INSE|nr:Hypothetical predicted protein [Cloeon dipterum]